MSGIDAFLEHLQVERAMSAHTLDAYRRDLDALADWARAQGAGEPVRLDASRLREFVAAEYRRGLSPKSLQRRLSACRSYYAWLLRNGVIPASPAAGLRAPKAPRKLPQVLDVDEAVRLVEVPTDAPLGLRDRALLELFYSSGLRLSELCALRWRDLQLDVGLITVLGKGGKQRSVPVGSHARRALDEWRASTSAGTDAFVFPGRGEGPISQRAVQIRIRQLAARQAVQARAPAHAAAQFRQPRARILRRPARRAGTARPRRHRHHPDLHAPGFPAPYQGLRRRASACEAQARRLNGSGTRSLNAWRACAGSGPVTAERRILQRPVEERTVAKAVSAESEASRADLLGLRPLLRGRCAGLRQRFGAHHASGGNPGDDWYLAWGIEPEVERPKHARL